MIVCNICLSPFFIRCKNFFKRSVVTTRPFVCKADNTCDIRLYDERGLRRKTSRCQACRYGLNFEIQEM